MTSNSSSFETIWTRLLTTALVGTARQQAESWAGTGELDSVLLSIQQQPDGDREGQLLSAAACVTGYRQVGLQPARLPQQAVAPLVAVDLPPCSPEAGRILSDLFRRRQSELISEWCVLAARAGKRAPDILLPKLLEAGRKSQDFAFEILPVLGHRGVWLAAQNPAWRYVDMSDPEEIWRTGERFHRLLLLRYLRVTDPATAREFVASTWKEETARERAAQLKVLRTGLSIEDEPFLESALDDRAKAVRSASVELLSCLASSRFVSRMTARAQAILTLKPGQGWRSRTRLSLILPEALDDAAVRDGVALDARDKGKRRSDWADAILSAVPPSTWSRQWQCQPDKAIQHAIASDWDELLVNAWIRATQRNRDERWAFALLQHDESRADLINCLSPPLRGQVVTEQIAGKDPLTGLAWAAAVNAQWDQDTSRNILKRLHCCYRSLDQILDSSPSQFSGRVLPATKRQISQLGMRMSPSVLTMTYPFDRWPDRYRYWAMLSGELETVLSQRLVMQKEIQDE